MLPKAVCDALGLTPGLSWTLSSARKAYSFTGAFVLPGLSECLTAGIVETR